MEVNEFLEFVPVLNEFLTRQANNFKAGRLATFLQTWRNITSDPEILHMVSSQHTEFCSEPVQTQPFHKGMFSDKERLIITSEIERLLVHIPGIDNVEADKQSMMSQSQLEWTFNCKIFIVCSPASHLPNY